MAGEGGHHLKSDCSCFSWHLYVQGKSIPDKQDWYPFRHLKHYINRIQLIVIIITNTTYR